MAELIKPDKRKVAELSYGIIHCEPLKPTGQQWTAADLLALAHAALSILQVREGVSFDGKGNVVIDRKPLLDRAAEMDEIGRETVKNVVAETFMVREEGLLARKLDRLKHGD